MRKLYFWYKLTRTLQEAPSSTKWYAACGTDAQTTGRFDDSVTRVGFVTCYDGQSAATVSAIYKRHVTQEAEAMGYTNNIVVAINAEEYHVLVHMEKVDSEQFDKSFFGVRT